MQSLTRVTLWLGGSCFIGFGLAFLIAPLQTLSAAGLELQGSLAATELRAFYGGLEIGVGLCLVGADLHREWRRPGLVLCLASYGGIGIARALGIVLAGGTSTFMWIALVTEVLLALMALVALGGGNTAD